MNFTSFAHIHPHTLYENSFETYPFELPHGGIPAGRAPAGPLGWSDEVESLTQTPTQNNNVSLKHLLKRSSS